MVLALKSQIEQSIAAALYDNFGINGAGHDLDLPEAERLKAVTGGYLLLPQDNINGPLCRLKIVGRNLVQVEIGGGDVFSSSTYNFQLRIAAVSKLYDNPTEASQAAARLEELFLILLNHLELTDLRVVWTDNPDKEGMAAILSHVSGEFDEVKENGESTAPEIAAAVARVGNSGTGVLVSQAASGSVYSGRNKAIYEVVIVTGNTTPGSMTGLTWKWRKNGGAYSIPAPATNGVPVTLDNSVQAVLTVSSGQSFAVGDLWTITANPQREVYSGLFYQNWNVLVNEQG